MARYFLDSSVLVKRYHEETGSSDIDGLFRSPDDRVFVSRLAIVEIHSTFARLVREGVITKDDFEKVTLAMEQDVANRVLTIAALSSRRLQEAAAVLATHGMTTPIRTLDAIHLATAQALHGRSRIAAFVAADKKLLVAAKACGLNVLEVG
jgi:predicted nucleic acid-binding protein